jgi:hypothetical protein
MTDEITASAPSGGVSQSLTFFLRDGIQRLGALIFPFRLSR